MSNPRTSAPVLAVVQTRQAGGLKPREKCVHKVRQDLKESGCSYSRATWESCPFFEVQRVIEGAGFKQEHPSASSAR
jgi:hypothetical protein